LLRIALSFVAAWTFLSWTVDASAFCRTTTCKRGEDECPKDEHGCVTEGVPVAWTGGCVGYSPNLVGTAQLSDDEWNAAFQESFHAWQLVDCGGGKHPSIQVFALRPTSCGESKYNSSGPNVNSVYFTDQGWAGPQTTENIDNVLARAKINFLPSGEILDGDVAINSGRKEFTITSEPGTVKEDLVSVLTHEIGHFLGIAHSPDPSAVMYFQYGTGSIRRQLQPDDIDAICTIYPPGRSATCDPTPRGGLQDSCGGETSVKPGCGLASAGESSSPLIPLLSLLGIIAALRRIRCDA
jgi:hypothetical protein